MHIDKICQQIIFIICSLHAFYLIAKRHNKFCFRFLFIHCLLYCVYLKLQTYRDYRMIVTNLSWGKFFHKWYTNMRYLTKFCPWLRPHFAAFGGFCWKLLRPRREEWCPTGKMLFSAKKVILSQKIAFETVVFFGEI